MMIRSMATLLLVMATMEAIQTLTTITPEELLSRSDRTPSVDNNVAYDVTTSGYSRDSDIIHGYDEHHTHNANTSTDKVINLGVMLERHDYWTWLSLDTIASGVNLAIEDFQATGSLTDYRFR